MSGNQFETAIPKDRVKPRVELPRHLEPAERLIGVEKRVLNSVAGILTIGKDGPRMAHCLGLVSLDNVAKRILGTRLAFIDGNVVVHFSFHLMYPADRRNIQNIFQRWSDFSNGIVVRDWTDFART